MFNQPKHNLMRAALAAGLTLCVAAALADTMPNVTSRTVEELSRDAGRAGVDTYWQSRPLRSWPAAVTKAYNATEHVAAKAYDEAKDLATQPSKQQSPERYGRADGYVGLDILDSPL